MSIAMHQPGSGPLKGLRIVEFAGIGPGPFAAMMLSDMGADVIRIERPSVEPHRADITLRGRTTVALDLKKDEDLDAARNLVAHADGLLEGFRPGVMERLGLGPDALHQINPRLVYGRITGWGQDGPWAHLAGHDINYISLPGALAAIGGVESPVPPLNLVGDYGGGALYLVIGMLAALLESKGSGRGQTIDAAMCDGTASLMTHFMSLTAMGKWRPERQSNLLDGGAHFYRTYECADGKHISVGAIESQFYALLREKLGIAADETFDAQLDRSQWPVQSAKLAELIRTQSRDHWCSLFVNTDACVAPVLTLQEAPAHPHLAARQTYVTAHDTLQPAPAPRFSRTPSSIQGPPGQPAGSLEEILSRWCSGTKSQSTASHS